MVNNVRSAFILIAVIVGNHMLIISHTDANHTDTATFPTKHVYEKCCKNQMTGASQRASCTVTKEWQNSNKLYSAYLWLFLGGWGGSLVLFVTLRAKKTCCCFFTKTLFLSIMYSITDTNTPEEMKCKQGNIHPYYNVD